MTADSPQLSPSLSAAHEAPDRNLALELVRVTEAAAMAAGRWVGRGDKNGADGVAVNAMRALISTVGMRGVVVIGEGEKDEAPIFASDGTAIKQRVTQFDIDMSLCCYCQLCVYPCPTVCILMTPEFEFAETAKENFLYRFAKEKSLAPPAEKKEHESAKVGA